MKKTAVVISAFAVVFGAIVACSSSSNNNNGGNSFPFSGPSCQGGQPGNTSSTCNTCMQNNCSSTYSCVSSDCNDYFTCFCACAQGDFGCYQGCQTKYTPACKTCNDNITQCQKDHCSNECKTSTTNPDAGNPGFDSGGGTPTGSCAQLKTCCDAISDANNKAACNALASYNNESACTQALSGYEEAGVCP